GLRRRPRPARRAARTRRRPRGRTETQAHAQGAPRRDPQPGRVAAGAGRAKGTLTSRTMFIHQTNTYDSTAAHYGLFWLRLAYSHWGLMLPRWAQFRGSMGQRPVWWKVLRLFLPLFRLDVWAHTGQCDIRWLFRLYVLGFFVGYKLK